MTAAPRMIFTAEMTAIPLGGGTVVLGGLGVVHVWWDLDRLIQEARSRDGAPNVSPSVTALADILRTEAAARTARRTRPPRSR